jgi:hypothetical protein
MRDIKLTDLRKVERLIEYHKRQKRRKERILRCLQVIISVIVLVGIGLMLGQSILDEVFYR